MCQKYKIAWDFCCNYIFKNIKRIRQQLAYQHYDEWLCKMWSPEYVARHSYCHSPPFRRYQKNLNIKCNNLQKITPRCAMTDDYTQLYGKKGEKEGSGDSMTGDTELNG